MLKKDVNIILKNSKRCFYLKINKKNANAYLELIYIISHNNLEFTLFSDKICFVITILNQNFP